VDGRHSPRGASATVNPSRRRPGRFGGWYRFGVRLISSSFLTLDGVMEGPGFDEHRDGRNAWALRIQDEETEAWNREQPFIAEALLLGRKTYQIWAAFWPTATGDPELTERMNGIRKYVVSNTLERADWNNSVIIRGDLATEIGRLKAQPGGELLCSGSADLLTGLMAAGLVDEYRLSIYPVILGSGKHLFRDQIDLQHLRLIGSRTFASGVVLLTYVPEVETPTSKYVEEFSWTQEQLRSLHAAEDTARVLATILFTDIVDSTGRAASVGDRAWRKLLDRHDQVASATVDKWHGRHVKSTGDGVLATFDAPTRGLQCAFNLRDALAAIGLEIRAAIHTGEVEIREADIGGIGVHIAARALETAASGQIVVTRTVRDLATGTDLAFAPLGSVGLRGVPGSWDLFEASSG
jgi:class 3 adenylate cyclase/dihydrofolate reductase